MSESLEPLIAVSGLPRSGTSLMMQMLVAGGFPVLTDDVRKLDSNNPKGYLEYDPVKNLATDQSWIPAAQGRAVKIIVQLLPSVPPDTPLKILLLDRPMVEVVESQAAMLRNLGRKPSANMETLSRIFAKQRETIVELMRQRPQVRILGISFHRLLQKDPVLISEVAAFLERPGLDLHAMADAIDPGLHRTKTGKSETVERARDRLPWQPGKCNGLIVVSVPKSGTNLLSRYLASVTGWPHRWGRPSRDAISLLDELPRLPDNEVASRAIHLIQTATDIAHLAVDQRPTLFGNRSLVSLEPAETAGNLDTIPPQQKHWLIAEHPVRSLPWFLRNPGSVPVLQPDEVQAEAAKLDFGVVFLYRDLKDIVNSLAHFLYAGTRFVHFRTLADAMEVAVYTYAPVLAAAIRTWKAGFPGPKITYEELTQNTRGVCQQIIDEFQLPVTGSRLIESGDEFRTFTFRKGGSGDWRNHLSDRQVLFLDNSFPDLISEKKM